MNNREFQVLLEIKEEQSKLGTQVVELRRVVDTVHDAIEGENGLLAWRGSTDRLIRFIRGAAIFCCSLLSGLILQSCAGLDRPSVTAVEQPEPIVTTTLTNTPTPTAYPTQYPTAWPTGTPTPTPSIIEITAIPEWELVRGMYTPSVRQFVRLGPGTEYPVLYRIEAGKSVPVLAQKNKLPYESWLCLKFGVDVFCDEFVALVYDRRFLGVLDED